MKPLLQLFLMITFAVVVTGCKNTFKTETSGSLITDSSSISPSGSEAQIVDDIQTQKPFKGKWAHIEKAEYDEQSDQTWGRYEEMLNIDFYDKNYKNDFWVANDHKEGYCTINYFKIKGNEADIRYECMSGAIFSGKLVYNQKDKSMTIIDGELLDKKDYDDMSINTFHILRGGTPLKFKGPSKAEASPGAMHFEGTLSKSKIKMQLDIQGEEVNGTYCYTKHNTPIILIGKVIDGVYTIDEFNHGNNTGTFTLTPKSDRVWTGYWSNGEKNLPVNIRMLQRDGASGY